LALAVSITSLTERAGEFVATPITMETRATVLTGARSLMGS
jgi:hypothetical protein